MWLLLIEDEKSLSASLKRGLEYEGYTVEVAHDGEEGCALALTHDYDLAIIDWRLPRKDGRAVVGRLRREGRTLPILMLTALGDVDHRVAGLDAGADDYLTKPFAFEELVARLRALTRRAQQGAAPLLRLTRGAVQMDTLRRSVWVGGHPLDLRPKEYALLEAFMRRADQVLSRTLLAERVWGDAFYVSDNVIDVSISRLRQKLTEAFEGRGLQGEVHIETVRGVGYRLAVDPST